MLIDHKPFWFHAKNNEYDKAYSFLHKNYMSPEPGKPYAPIPIFHGVSSGDWNNILAAGQKTRPTALPRPDVLATAPPSFEPPTPALRITETPELAPVPVEVTRPSVYTSSLQVEIKDGLIVSEPEFRYKAVFTSPNHTPVHHAYAGVSNSASTELPASAVQQTSATELQIGRVRPTRQVDQMDGAMMRSRVFCPITEREGAIEILIDA